MVDMELCASTLLDFPLLFSEAFEAEDLLLPCVSAE